VLAGREAVLAAVSPHGSGCLPGNEPCLAAGKDLQAPGSLGQVFYSLLSLVEALQSVGGCRRLCNYSL